MAATTRAARRKAAEPEEDAVDNGRTLREPSAMHELMAAYFNEHYNADVTPLQCAIFTSKRTEFRRSDEYQEYRASGGKDEAEAAPAAKPRGRQRTAKTEPADEEAKPTGRRGRGRTAAAAKPEADEPAEAKAAPARRNRRGGRSEAEESPAPEAKPTTSRRGRGRASAKPAAEEEPF